MMIPEPRVVNIMTVPTVERVAMPSLFEPLSLRSVSLRNRIVVSPMCQYSSSDGFANDWHLVHLGSRAVGGAALVITEATAVLPEGRIHPADLGIWNDDHIEMLSRITRFVQGQGAVPGMQLAHAGRKASTHRPWDKQRGQLPFEQGGWEPLGPSPLAFDQHHLVPREMSEADIQAVVRAFGQAAGRAQQAGFEMLEVHAAHGYLLNSFLSPLSNQRADRYGGSFENRARLLREVVEGIRAVWPERFPLSVRLSCTEWLEGGWTIDDSVRLSRVLGELGVDLIDCSSGGNWPGVRIPIGPGYQTMLAEQIRREAKIMTAAVGLIVDPAQADHVIRTGQADLVYLARQMLRDPYWPLTAAKALGVPLSWPFQYLRAAPPGTPGR